jgi:hypothetical protein
MYLRRFLFLAAGFALLLPNLATADVCTAVVGNLVTNCGFETGDFSGWSQGGNTGATFVASNFDSFTPNSGTFFAALGPVGSDGTLSQTLTTVPGTLYAITWFLGSDGGTPNDFSATWGGTTLFSQKNLPTTNGTYNEFTTNIAASTSTTVLMFSFRNDPGYQALDDVSVASTTTPEPGFYALLGVGLAGLIQIKRHNFKTRSRTPLS